MSLLNISRIGLNFKLETNSQLFSTCSVLWRRRKGGPVVATGPATSPVLTTDIKRDKDPDAPVLLEPNWQIEFHQSKKAAINPLMRILRERKLEDKTGIAPFKVPFKMTIEKGKLYKWCSCGRSKAQPFCDNTHRMPAYKIHQLPLFFKAPETKEVFLCQCKQTNNPPFCDGTHRDLPDETIGPKVD